MRTRLALILAGALVLGSAADAQAQGVYAGGIPYGYWYYGAPPAGAGYSRNYNADDEPEMSITRSYLGYSGSDVHVPAPPTQGSVTGYGAVAGAPAPAPSQPPTQGTVTGYGAAWAPGYVRVPAPTYRGVPWFGGWRGYRWGYPY